MNFETKAFKKLQREAAEASRENIQAKEERKEQREAAKAERSDFLEAIGIVNEGVTFNKRGAQHLRGRRTPVGQGKGKFTKLGLELN